MIIILTIKSRIVTVSEIDDYINPLEGI